MTVPATSRRAGPYNGNGSTTTFSFSFKTFDADDLLVTRTASGVDTTLVKDSDYSVTLNGDQDANPGGSITYPISGSALASGQSLTIIGDLPYEQTTDLLGGGAFNARVIEDTFDRTVVQIQQLKEVTDRALIAPIGLDADATLPYPEASKVIGWNEAGDGLQNYDASAFASVIAYGTANADVFTGNGSTAAFTLSASPATINNLDVAIDGVTQYPTTDYTWSSGTTLTFTSAPPNGSKILVRYAQALALGNADAASTQYLPAGTGAVPTTVQSKLREWISPTDFGAVGNADISGTSGTNDAAAFALLEAAHTNKVVNLEGKIYLVNSPIPTANNYINGKFVVAAASTDDQPVNFAFGYRALRVNNYVPLQWPAGGGIDYASGNYNTAIGDSALQANTIGRRNTALGSFALFTNTTGAYNTAVGPLALYSNTSGGENTAIGVQAGQSNTTGSDNVSVGSGAMSQHATSNDCVAIGRQAMQIAPASTARVIAIGRQAAWQYATGTDTVAIGYQALSNAGAVGSFNVAIGSPAMGSATSANSNVAIGRRALNASAASVGCVAIGNDAMVSATGGDGTVAIGNTANPNNTTGGNNVFIGAAVATANSTGYSNVAIGRATFTANLGGYNNVAVGEQCGTTNTTGYRNTWLGTSSGTSGTAYAETACLGYNAQVTGNYQNQIGGSGTTTYAYGAVQDRSDARDKADVRDTVLGLEFINALRPVDFKWDMREDYRTAPPAPPAPDASDDEKAAHVQAMQAWAEENKLAKITHNGSKKRNRYHHGLIAQEVKAACDAAGVDFGGFQNHAINGGDDVLSIGYAELIGPLIKAVQQLSARVAALEAK